MSAAPLRILRALPRLAFVTLAATCLVHLVVDLLPGDAATRALGTATTPEALSHLRAEWGLDHPPLRRVATWLSGLVEGDLGLSIGPGRRPVGELIDAPLQRTLILAPVAALAGASLGVLAGILTGLRRGGTTDRLVSAAALLVISCPEFVTATVVVLVFAVWLGIAPATSHVPLGDPVWAHPELLALPALTLALVLAAFLTRLVQGVVADQTATAHVEAAVLSGLPRPVVVRRHLLPSSVAPICQVLALCVPFVFGGSVVVESVFGYPGIGSLLVERIAARDTTTVAALALLIAAVSAAAYRIADSTRSTR